MVWKFDMKFLVLRMSLRSSVLDIYLDDVGG